MTALWSLNEKASGREGIDLEPPSGFWADDCLYALTAETEAIEEALSDVRRQARGEEDF